MANKISVINNELLEIHNILTGKNHKLIDIENIRSKSKVYESLIHDNGISGKVPSGDTINPNKYYSLLELV